MVVAGAEFEGCPLGHLTLLDDIKATQIFSYMGDGPCDFFQMYRPPGRSSLTQRRVRWLTNLCS